MMFRAVFWVVLPPSSGMMEAVRTSETSVDNYFTRQYIPEDNSEQHVIHVDAMRMSVNFFQPKGLFFIPQMIYKFGAAVECY
jgi:hypothetical protein